MTELLMHPALLLVAAAVVVRLAPRPVGDVVMVLAPIGALWQILALGRDTTIEATYLAFDLVPLRADALSYPFALIFAAVAIVAGIYGIRIQRAGERMAVLITVAAGIGVVYAGDLLTFFLFWEIKAVASTFVILARRTDGARRAGMRYLFVHIVGGKILLAGVLLHLATTGSLAFEAFDPSLAAWLILLACAVNAAIPPLHAWLKDGYPEASVAGMVFLSAFTTKSAVYALIRGFAGYEILLVMGVIMAIYGVTYAILENDVRRLLAYHIISQVGFMVTAVGIGSEAALNGATAHAVAHILYKGLLLMGVGALLYATGRSKASALGGLANRMRGVLVLYLIGAASISSVPLLSGFVSKELVIDAAYQGDLTWLVLTLKVVSVGTFLSTGLKLPYAAWFGPTGAGPRTNDRAPFPVAKLPVTMYAAMGIAALANLVLGLFPGLLYDIMPFAVDYTPYSVGKVVEKLQLLGFTALGFFLLLHKLGAKPVINLDTDAAWRLLPGARDATRRIAAQPSLAGPGVPVARPTATSSPAPVGRQPAIHRGTPEPVAEPRPGNVEVTDLRSTAAATSGSGPGPGAEQPATTGPGSAQPASTGPGAEQPATTGPGSAQPASTGPGSPQPATTGPGSPQPATTGPGASGATATRARDPERDRDLDIDAADSGPTLTAAMRFRARQAQRLAASLVAPQHGTPNLAATWALGAVFLGSAILLLALAVLS